MFIKVLNQKGKEVGETELPKEIFEVPMNPDLVHQVVLVQAANRRRKIAKTKDRSEVRGGGKKPWRQKGTGRARHGSIRSPIWRGGGVTFGPTGREVFKKRIPKKMRRKALFMVLSAKAKENLIFVLDNLKIEKPKTKIMVEILEQLFLKKSSGLLVLPKIDENIIKSVRNIPKIDPIQAKDLNVLDLLNYKYIVMPKEAIEVIKETFL
ncbi:MAG: 50S ribosomal protein L4 [Candidatus Nealsonbacteria bacterium CG10_big_fil_rev_8_21_14_0_10_36_24]|uniref:Large ribosomal subunit protein uL4 n=2 Tax=Candidatus Nealsoniibacteriota TaxID=1817911 RepID=A0A2H0YN72_9BACT|nr:MAG: 50S ribosomal protein L4 [Candidatus Nealsonbacteria bacterium CG10_big_fil_rev_8_21_14_0_10_36_24]PIS39866.1 MAG: 50S ribosomal protein L4 [Candidatus Nealsonbacteria bacterium CG08_land_8_20_14_0_20_36_22]